jgi:hypothetical protein
MSRLITYSEQVLLTLWVGSLWAIGYIAAPVLFSVQDDRHLAGELAGHMFHIVNIIGLLCGALLLIDAIYTNGGNWMRTWRVWTLAAMLLFVVIGLFVLQPMMQELKLQGLVPGSAQASQFGRLHGVSSLLYLATSLMGLALVIWGVRPRVTQDGSQVFPHAGKE